VKLLCFLARRFAWEAFSQTLEEADQAPELLRGEVESALVVWLHAERMDEQPEARKRAFKQTLKHVKWLANKRERKSIVLHSFTHLGGETAAADFARDFLVELDERLSATGYSVRRTPFGWFCSWELAAEGESLAKVWKEIGPRSDEP